MLAEREPGWAAVAEARRRAAQLGRPVLASITRPVAQGDALQGFSGERRAAWLQPDQQLALVGQGAAAVLIGHGEGRLAEVQRQWCALLEQAVIDDAAGLPTSGPLLLGGLSFDPQRPRTALWAGFGDAGFVLPQQTLLQTPQGSWLTTNMLVPPPSQPQPVEDRDEPPHLPAALPADAAWCRLVDEVAAAIRAQRTPLQKVVLARAERIPAVSPSADAPAVLRRLAAAYPSCTVFGLGQADACFLGASPERLVRLRHGVVATVALAGSAPRGATPDEDRRLGQHLLRDPKELREHQIVVDALHDGLAPLVEHLVSDPAPRLERLPNVQHLRTRLAARAAPGTSILDLVARLHPTPAMGGWPRAEALALIREREGLDRGWYAGAIGWCNAALEGEFVVGIRSALLRGEQATLFAGCGIVAHSEAVAEYAESTWKLRPLRAALGVPHA